MVETELRSLWVPFNEDLDHTLLTLQQLRVGKMISYLSLRFGMPWALFDHELELAVCCDTDKSDVNKRLDELQSARIVQVRWTEGLLLVEPLPDSTNWDVEWRGRTALRRASSA